MHVRDAMTTVVLTVGPDHTLREAARRMTARGVGAVVVIDEQQAGPGILTERDILRSIGADEAPDEERVSGHLTSNVILAAPDWSLEQAATEMVRGGFRHVIVVDSAEVVGILSMRDIVRCWTAEGATAEVVSGAGLR
ncbi:MAG: CBS domain-containing protein [Acidobacteriota bacterium]|nr:CBS domain-containing protein [Acidobacteriota bacterium]